MGNTTETIEIDRRKDIKNEIENAIDKNKDLEYITLVFEGITEQDCEVLLGAIYNKKWKGLISLQSSEKEHKQEKYKEYNQIFKDLQAYILRTSVEVPTEKKPAEKPQEEDKLRRAKIDLIQGRPIQQVEKEQVRIVELQKEQQAEKKLTKEQELQRRKEQAQERMKEREKQLEKRQERMQQPVPPEFYFDIKEEDLIHSGNIEEYCKKYHNGRENIIYPCWKNLVGEYAEQVVEKENAITHVTKAAMKVILGGNRKEFAYGVCLNNLPNGFGLKFEKDKNRLILAYDKRLEKEEKERPASALLSPQLRKYAEISLAKLENNTVGQFYPFYKGKITLKDYRDFCDKHKKTFDEFLSAYDARQLMQNYKKKYKDGIGGVKIYYCDEIPKKVKLQRLFFESYKGPFILRVKDRNIAKTIFGTLYWPEYDYYYDGKELILMRKKDREGNEKFFDMQGKELEQPFNALMSLEKESREKIPPSKEKEQHLGKIGSKRLCKHKHIFFTEGAEPLLEFDQALQRAYGTASDFKIIDDFLNYIEDFNQKLPTKEILEVLDGLSQFSSKQRKWCNALVKQHINWLKMLKPEEKLSIFEFLNLYKGFIYFWKQASELGVLSKLPEECPHVSHMNVALDRLLQILKNAADPADQAQRLSELDFGQQGAIVACEPPIEESNRKQGHTPYYLVTKEMKPRDITSDISEMSEEDKKNFFEKLIYDLQKEEEKNGEIIGGKIKVGKMFEKARDKEEIFTRNDQEELHAWAMTKAARVSIEGKDIEQADCKFFPYKVSNGEHKLITYMCAFRLEGKNITVDVFSQYDRRGEVKIIPVQSEKILSLLKEKGIAKDYEIDYSDPLKELIALSGKSAIKVSRNAKRDTRIYGELDRDLKELERYFYRYIGTQNFTFPFESYQEIIKQVKSSEIYQDYLSNSSVIKRLLPILALTTTGRRVFGEGRDVVDDVSGFLSIDVLPRISAFDIELLKHNPRIMLHELNALLMLSSKPETINGFLKQAAEKGEVVYQVILNLQAILKNKEFVKISDEDKEVVDKNFLAFIEQIKDQDFPNQTEDVKKNKKEILLLLASIVKREDREKLAELKKVINKIKNERVLKRVNTILKSIDIAGSTKLASIEDASNLLHALSNIVNSEEELKELQEQKVQQVQPSVGDWKKQLDVLTDKLKNKFQGKIAPKEDKELHLMINDYIVTYLPGIAFKEPELSKSLSMLLRGFGNYAEVIREGIKMFEENYKKVLGSFDDVAVSYLGIARDWLKMPERTKKDKALWDGAKKNVNDVKKALKEIKDYINGGAINDLASIKSLEDLGKEKGSLNEEITKLQNEIKKVNSGNEELKKTIDRLNGEIKKGNAGKAVLKKEINRLNDKIKKAESKKNKQRTLKLFNRVKEVNFEKQKEELATKQKELETKQKEVKTKTDELNGKQKLLKAKQKEIDALKQERENVNKELAGWVGEIKFFTSEVERIRKEIDGIMADIPKEETEGKKDVTKFTEVNFELLRKNVGEINKLLESVGLGKLALKLKLTKGGIKDFVDKVSKYIDSNKGKLNIDILERINKDIVEAIDVLCTSVSANIGETDPFDENKSVCKNTREPLPVVNKIPGVSGVLFNALRFLVNKGIGTVNAGKDHICTLVDKALPEVKKVPDLLDGVLKSKNNEARKKKVKEVFAVIDNVMKVIEHPFNGLGERFLPILSKEITNQIRKFGVDKMLGKLIDILIEEIFLQQAKRIVNFLNKKFNLGLKDSIGGKKIKIKEIIKEGAKGSVRGLVFSLFDKIIAGSFYGEIEKLKIDNSVSPSKEGEKKENLDFRFAELLKGFIKKISAKGDAEQLKEDVNAAFGDLEKLQAFIGVLSKINPVENRSIFIDEYCKICASLKSSERESFYVGLEKYKELAGFFAESTYKLDAKTFRRAITLVMKKEYTSQNCKDLLGIKIAFDKEASSLRDEIFSEKLLPFLSKSNTVPKFLSELSGALDKGDVDRREYIIAGMRYALFNEQSGTAALEDLVALTSAVTKNPEMLAVLYAASWNKATTQDDMSIIQQINLLTKLKEKDNDALNLLARLYIQKPFPKLAELDKKSQESRFNLKEYVEKYEKDRLKELQKETSLSMVEKFIKGNRLLWEEYKLNVGYEKPKSMKDDAIYVYREKNEYNQINWFYCSNKYKEPERIIEPVIITALNEAIEGKTVKLSQYELSDGKQVELKKILQKEQGYQERFYSLSEKEQKDLFEQYKYIIDILRTRKIPIGKGDIIKSVYDFTAQELTQHFQKCAEVMQNDPKNISARLECLAVLSVAMLRATGKFPRHSQIIAVLNSFLYPDKNLVEQIATGEGKSIITALMAGLQYARGKHVHVTSSNFDLAERDCAEYNDFYTLLKIPVSAVSSVETKYIYDERGVRYGTPSDFSLYWAYQKMIMGQRPPQREKMFLIADEVDAAMLDESTTFNLPSIAADPYENRYKDIYPLINDFIDTDISFSKDMKEKALKIKSKEDIARLREYLKDKVDDAMMQDIQDARLDIWLDSACVAKQLQEDKDYVIGKQIRERAGKKENISVAFILNNNIVDTKSKFSKGVHQCLHERLNKKFKSEIESGSRELFPCDAETEIVSSTNVHDFFTAFGEMICWTGSAGSSMELEELQKRYNLEILELPRYEERKLETYAPIFAYDNASFWTQKKAYYAEIKKEIEKALKVKPQRPVLIVCKDIEKAEAINEMLKEFLKSMGYADNLPLQLVHGENVPTDDKGKFEHMKKVTENAAKDGMITVTTPMMGRGTDIKAKNLLLIQTDLFRIRDTEQVWGRPARNGVIGGARCIFNLDEIAKSYGCKFPEGLRRRQKIKQLLEAIQRKWDEDAQANRKYFIRLGEIRSSYVLCFDKLFFESSAAEREKILSQKFIFLGQFEKTWKEMLDDNLHKCDPDDTEYLNPYIRRNEDGELEFEELDKLVENFEKKIGEIYGEAKNALPSLSSEPIVSIPAKKEGWREFTKYVPLKKDEVAVGAKGVANKEYTPILAAESGAYKNYEKNLQAGEIFLEKVKYWILNNPKADESLKDVVNKGWQEVTKSVTDKNGYLLETIRYLGQLKEAPETTGKLLEFLAFALEDMSVEVGNPFKTELMQQKKLISQEMWGTMQNMLLRAADEKDAPSWINELVREISRIPEGANVAVSGIADLEYLIDVVEVFLDEAKKPELRSLLQGIQYFLDAVCRQSSKQYDYKEAAGLKNRRSTLQKENLSKERLKGAHDKLHNLTDKYDVIVRNQKLLDDVYFNMESLQKKLTKGKQDKDLTKMIADVQVRVMASLGNNNLAEVFRQLEAFERRLTLDPKLTAFSAEERDGLSNICHMNTELLKQRVDGKSYMVDVPTI